MTRLVRQSDLSGTANNATRQNIGLERKQGRSMLSDEKISLDQVVAQHVVCVLGAHHSSRTCTNHTTKRTFDDFDPTYEHRVAASRRSGQCFDISMSCRLPTSASSTRPCIWQFRTDCS